MNKYAILQGDVMDRLRHLPDESVHTIVTSPPYFGLRDYGIPGRVWEVESAPECDHEWEWEHVEREMRRGVNLAQSDASTRGGAKKIAEVGWQKFKRGFCMKCGAWFGPYGLEPTVELYIDHTLRIFREAWRVLRKDGTLWLNLGDSYANDGKWGGHTGGKHAKALHDTPIGRNKRYTGLKPKELWGMPWRVALALMQNGWWLRRDIIWHKPNPMPESVRDRPTTSHEYIFLFTKSRRYFYDAEATKVPGSWNTHSRGHGVNPKSDTGVGWDKRNVADDHDPRNTRVRVKVAGANSRVYHDRDMEHRTRSKQNPSFSGAVTLVATVRNDRSVWRFATQAYKEAHFATFPVALPRKCILAATSEKGVCPICGAPWKRTLERKFYGDFADKTLKAEGVVRQRDKNGEKFYREQYEGPKTIGWQPTCACGLDEQSCVPATVLDPFSGAASTGVAALELGRQYLGVELNAEYVKMSLRRLKQTEIRLAEPAKPKKERRPPVKGQQSLFKDEVRGVR